MPSLAHSWWRRTGPGARLRCSAGQQPEESAGVTVAEGKTELLAIETQPLRGSRRGIVTHERGQAAVLGTAREREIVGEREREREHHLLPAGVSGGAAGAEAHLERGLRHSALPSRNPSSPAGLHELSDVLDFFYFYFLLPLLPPAR